MQSNDIDDDEGLDTFVCASIASETSWIIYETDMQRTGGERS